MSKPKPVEAADQPPVETMDQEPPTSPPADITSAIPPAPEAFKRPEALFFIGERLPTGEPVEHLAGYGIDARDYPKGDPWLARLTDDQIKFALDSKLYRRTKPDTPEE